MLKPMQKKEKMLELFEQRRKEGEFKNKLAEWSIL